MRTLYLYKGSQNRVFWKKVEIFFVVLFFGHWRCLAVGRQLPLALFSSQFSSLAARAAWARSRALYLYKGSEEQDFRKKDFKIFWQSIRDWHGVS